MERRLSATDNANASRAGGHSAGLSEATEEMPVGRGLGAFRSFPSPDAAEAIRGVKDGASVITLEPGTSPRISVTSCLCEGRRGSTRREWSPPDRRSGARNPCVGIREGSTGVRAVFSGLQFPNLAGPRHQGCSSTRRCTRRQPLPAASRQQSSVAANCLNGLCIGDVSKPARQRGRRYPHSESWYWVLEWALQ